MNVPERKPMILVIARPNGSGKSTITQYYDFLIYFTKDSIYFSTSAYFFKIALLTIVP